MALFEQVARRDERLAKLFADDLTEAARKYADGVYLAMPIRLQSENDPQPDTEPVALETALRHGRRFRRQQLRETLTTLRRLDLGPGKQRAERDWVEILQLGKQVQRKIATWITNGRQLADRGKLSVELADLVRPLGEVKPDAISRVLAAGLKPTRLTARVLALAVYGLRGNARHILNGVKSILEDEDHNKPFDARVSKFLSPP